jgi:mannose-1-phosphate guanylyltransferase
MTSERLFAVILAGGSGTRFWPASRKALPKQFLPIASRKTMIADTAARLSGLVEPESTLVVTSREHSSLVRKYLRKIPPENVLAEPTGRNTAAAVAWAALEIAQRDPASVQVVLPSDHVIEPVADFRRALRAAAEEALRDDVLLTFGIRPNSPATGYGYIEAGARTSGNDAIAVHAVARFVEKPDLARAKEFLASGRFFWNAGIFVWSTRSILSALSDHASATYEPLARAVAERTSSAIERTYPSLPFESIDIAVLEKAANVRVVPIDFTWNDVGSWSALSAVHPLDARGNCAVGGTRVVAADAQNCIVYGGKGELTALIGVRDLVVVRSGKAVLVCPRERAQEVKEIVARLAEEGPNFL